MAAIEARRIGVTAVEGHTRGILVAKLSEDAVDEALEMRSLDGEVSEDTSLEQKAVVVFLHMIEGDKAKKWECVKCERCDGAYDESCPFCPYCGEGLDDWHSKMTEEDDDKDESVAAVESRAMVPSVLSGAGPSKAIVPASPPGAMAIAKNTPGGLVRFTVRDLDAAVDRVSELKGQLGVNWWELGEAINRVYKNSIWRLRTREDGRSQKYRTWEQFCHEEFRMLPQSARNAMDTHLRYPKAYAEKYGKSKMTILVRAHTEEERVEMERLLEQGASVAELKEVHKEAIEEKREAGEKLPRRQQLPTGEVVERTYKPPTKRPDGSSTRKPAAPRPADTKVTAAVVEGLKGTSKLWAKPPGKLAKGLSDISTLSRAKTLEDVPAGKIELKNAVTIYFKIVEKDGGLEAQWEIARDRDVEEE